MLSLMKLARKNCFKNFQTKYSNKNDIYFIFLCALPKIHKFKSFKLQISHDEDKRCPSIKIYLRSCFPEKDWEFSHLEEDILFGLMNDVSAKVFANDTVPSWATTFVHFVLKVSWENFFLFVLFDGCFEAFVEVLEDTVDILLIHVSGFDLRFGFRGGHWGLFIWLV